MGQFGSKLRRVTDGLAHWCPACEEMHAFALDRPNSSGAQWKWNGNVEAPTFTPSMNIKISAPDHPHHQPGAGSTVCHYILTAGIIQFCGDSTHVMKDARVPLPDLPPHMRD